MKRSSLSISGFDPHSLTAVTYDPMSADLAEVDIDFDFLAVSPELMAAEPKGSDPAIVNDQSSWQIINRELRSLRVEIADLRREIRSLRDKRVGQR